MVFVFPEFSVFSENSGIAKYSTSNLDLPQGLIGRQN
jgi:hypothetical protein